MLNELENKIRKAIPELKTVGLNNRDLKPIQLNHVLEYLRNSNIISTKENFKNKLYIVYANWNLKSNLLSEQSQDLIKYLNDL